MKEVILQAVLKATSEIIVVSLAGIYLSRKGILLRPELKKVSLMIEQLLTPALIFSNFVLNLNTLDIFSWLPVFVCSAVIIVVQMTLGLICNRLLIRDRFYENMIVVGNGLVNTTGIQLVLIKSLHHQLDLITTQQTGSVDYYGQRALHRGFYFVMLTTLVHTLTRWTVGKVALGSVGGPEETLLQPMQVESVPDDEYRYRSCGWALFYQLVDFLPSVDGETLRKMFNTPVQVSLCTMVLCAVPPLRQAMVEEESILRIVLVDPLSSLGNVYSVFILIFLGCNIYLLDPATAVISNKTIMLCSLVKLVVSPILGVWVVGQLVEHSLSSADPVLIFIYMINFASPTAINLLTIATTYSKVGDDMAKLLIVQYVCYTALLPLLLNLFLSHYIQ